ncbi:TniB family NTP-binding protein [Pseudomonas syringae]|uniref:TniB family NTP-binding protein n=1 Tax=Pseudomonas syringae TaxID=317 RepID=UPI003AF3FB4E
MAFAGTALILDNFQDIGLLPQREVKLALAFLRSLGRTPYDITVVAIGSSESLDVIKNDKQLAACWATYGLIANTVETE